MRRLPVLAALAAAIALAVPAHADPDKTTDEQFIDALNKAGITYQNPNQAKLAAEQVCALIGEGQTGPSVAREMAARNPGFEEANAEKFTVIAVTTYCPLYANGSGATGDK